MFGDIQSGGGGAVSRSLSQINGQFIPPRWFKVTYAFSVPVSAPHLHGEKKGEFSTIFEEVPGSGRKIGGMLVPQEVSSLLQAAILVLRQVRLGSFATRRAGKFKKQGG